MKSYDSSEYIWSTLLKLGKLFLLIIAFFIIGVVLGYSFLGSGKVSEVFNFSTWEHIFDFVKT